MRPFRRVLAAEVVSNFGSMLTRLVIPWIATLTLAATPLQMGLLAIADVVAGAAGALLLGVLVDRVSTLRVMIAADLARAALMVALAVATWRGWVSLWMLLVVAALSGLATMAFELARSAWIACNIETRLLATRNSQLAAAESVTEAASFGVGGWIYQALGSALSLAVDAATYVVSALFLARVGEARVATHARVAWPRWRDLLAEARAGIATLLDQPALRAIAQVHVLVAIALSLAGTSYMIYVARDLALDPGVLGMIFAVGGVGAALGAAFAPRIGRWAGSRGAIVWGLGFAALGAFMVPLAGGPAAVAVALLVGHQLIGDAGYVVHEIHDRTLRQSIAPADRLARVDAGLRTLGQLATLAGALGGGTLATSLGARAALFLAATILVGAAGFAQLALARAPHGAGAALPRR